MELAMSKQCLNKDSVLHAILCDTIVSLMKSEEHQKSKYNIKPMLNKCGKSGYALVREILPIPCMTTVNFYRQANKSYQAISQDNLKIFQQEVTIKNSKGIGGVHWDEVFINKRIKVCARTNEIVGFEDLEIDTNISTAIDFEHDGEGHKEKASEVESSDSENDTSSESSSTWSDEEEKTTFGSQKAVAKLILQFFWSSIEGDFTWPVASFPLCNINAKTLSKCVWDVVRVLSNVKFGKVNKSKFKSFMACAMEPP